MSDDDREPDDHILGGMSIPLPAELLARLSAEHDKQHMSLEAEQAREDRFLDSLDVDGLLALRWILRSNPENAFANNSRYDGVIETLLRRVHKVNNDGEPLERLPES
jgi:hypothetical protein